MRYRRNFGVINNDVLRNPALPATAKALYSVLCGYVNEDGVCWPSNQTLANALGAHVNTVRRNLDELEQAGVIHREERRDERGQQTNLTYLIDSKGNPSVVGGGTTDGGEPPTTGGTQNKTSGTRPVTTSPSKPDGFDDWWDLYPRKTHRAEAERAYRRAVEERHATSALLLTALHGQVQHLAKDLRYCPHPATWINRGDWQDTPIPAAVNNTQTYGEDFR